MKKKIISLCLVIALVATAIAGATLAYFTDVTKVNTNTFTVGDVDIKLDETDIKNPNGDRVTENEYENIYPNQTVVKDPMVTVEAGSRECYVRMIVTLDADMVEALKSAFPANDDDFKDFWKGDLFLLEKLVGGYDEDTWVINEDATGIGYYEFWYKETVDASKAEEDVELAPLFTSVTFPADMTNEQIAALNGFEVDIVAHAMQAEGFDTAAEAWDAWTATGESNLTTEATEATVETTEAPEDSGDSFEP